MQHTTRYSNFYTNLQAMITWNQRNDTTYFYGLNKYRSVWARCGAVWGGPRIMARASGRDRGKSGGCGVSGEHTCPLAQLD